MRIEDYGLIGDTQTAALVGRNGSIDWLCLPRFDSGACFAALLGDRSAGRWMVAPAASPVRVERRYIPGTLVLETMFHTPGGTVRLTDFMPIRGQALDVVRVVDGVAGTVEMEMDLVVRFDYGSTIPWVRRIDGTLSLVAGPDALELFAGVPVHGEDQSSVANFTVRAGDRVPFVLTWHRSHEAPPQRADAERALADTVAWWQAWSDRCRQGGPWSEAVRSSLVTLKGLTYAPTGGMVAAPTTSLPEVLGGARNWDYRYCWLRDATFTLQALLAAGYEGEAVAWRDWLLRAVAGDPAQLQIMYGVAGERRLPELELPWLRGYESSRPVRIGNGAAEQRQLDVPGEVMDTLHQARVAGIPPEPEAWAMERALLDWLESAWREVDSGLWEVRGDPRHFVHSKVMCWVAFDRGVRAVEEFGSDGPVARWRGLRDEVHREVCEQGWDSTRRTFTQSYGSKGLDASLLMIPMVGFLPPSDERVVGTIEAVQRELSVDGFIERYPTSGGDSVDGLVGQEGAFLLCTFWLADALAMIGRTEEATQLFERLLGLRNDVGLLAEEYDPHAGRMLGNFPQAFSHIGLVNTALNLTEPTWARGPATEDLMRAMTVVPGRPGSAALTEIDGPPGEGDVLVQGLAVGICGTDVEIADGRYGTAPEGAEHLVLGHESLGRILEAPPDGDLAPGDLVVGIVRRPDPVPCAPCAVGSWDMCRNGLYTERGIKGLHGYGAEQWRIDAGFLVPVPTELGDLAVLVEPTSVVAKAWDHIEKIIARAPIVPRTALITGAGPIGLLAALLAAQRGLEVHVLDHIVDGPKPGLVADLGASYHTGAVTDLPPADIVIECTGAPSVVLDVIQRNARAGVTCLTGVSTGGRTVELDVGAANRRIVLENDVVFGSVNANRSHYLSATEALAAADPSWLARLLTRRVPLSSWTEGLERQTHDVKVVIDLTG